MLILGIETSCDETSAAIVADGRVVRSIVVSSQIAEHAPYGGVVPEIASRQHVRAILPVARGAIEQAGIANHEVDAVAATYGPGLAGALLVGVSFARGLALALNIPLIPVNHLEGHLHSVWLTDEDCDAATPKFPLLALIVSGGHSELILMADHGEYRLLGRTLDDAAGEAFDKAGRLLGLPYPGGPSIQAASRAATSPVRFPRASLRGTYDFSFSGLKTAVLHEVIRTATGKNASQIRGSHRPRVDLADGLTDQQVADIAAGFQESVVDVLATKTAAAADEYDVAGVAVVGGVAANAALRARMRQVIRRPLFIAAPKFSTDNAAMIAAAAFYRPRAEAGADIEPDLALV